MDVAARPELRAYDFAALAQRAIDQRERLLPFHRSAAREALAADTPSLVEVAVDDEA